MQIVAVAIGGAVGSVLRYLAGRIVPSSLIALPWGTLLVNVIGCGLLGFFVAVAGSRATISPAVKSFVTVGLLGGLTTFSAFGHETITLFQGDRFLAAVVNVALNVICGLLAAWAGWRLGTRL